MDNKKHFIKDKWDLIIAHPPCTYLSTVSNRSYSLKFNSASEVLERYKKRDEAIRFFMIFINADCERICVENPQGYMNTHFRKPNQVIHPYYFVSTKEDEEYVMKRTCLWLKNLPELQRINDLEQPNPIYISSGKITGGRNVHWCEAIKAKGGKKERSKARSKTFLGIAREMAIQWGGYIDKEI